MIELSIKIKDEKSSLTEKHLCYDALLISRESAQLHDLVKDALEKFKQEPQAEAPDVTIKIKMIW